MKSPETIERRVHVLQGEFYVSKDVDVMLTTSKIQNAMMPRLIVNACLGAINGISS